MSKDRADRKVNDVGAVETLREWYDQMNAGEIAAAAAKFHPAIEWIEADHSPYGWPHRLVGIDAIVEGVWSKLARDWSDLRLVPEEFHLVESTAFVLGRYAGTRRGSGARLDAQIVHAWDFNDDGLIIRYRGFADTYALHQVLDTA